MKVGPFTRFGSVAVLVVLVAAAPASAQILNTLRGFDKAASGWSGEAGAFFSAAGGNTENLSLTSAGSVQWKGTVNRWRLHLEATRTESRRETTEDASAVHLRHNMRLSRQFASLAFVQHQRDRFQRLDTRFLFGAGLRWDLLQRKKVEGSWGVSPMLEVERVEDHGSEARGRLSTFVTVLGRINDRTSVDLTTFVQPALDELADVRAVAASSLRVEIAGGLSLILSARVQHDAKPVDDVEETDWKTKTGLSAAF